MSKIIWVDLDEVLAEFIDYTLDYYNYTIKWKIIKKEYIRDYYLYNMSEFNLNLEEAINLFRKSMDFDKDKFKVKPVVWAYEKLKKYKNMWYSFKIITARDWDLFWEYTYKWIEKYYSSIFDDIVFANYFSKKEKSKADICKEHGVYVMIEDNIDYALELVQNNIKTFLIEKPWNKERLQINEKLIKVKNWNEIYF